MYTAYSATSIALTAKLSLQQAHLSLYEDYSRSYNGCQLCCSRNCFSCSPSLPFPVPRNPRFIYYGYLLRRNPSLFRLEPSRALLVPRRSVRVCDRGYSEVIRLLAERQRCCRCYKGDSFASDDGDFDESPRKVGSWREKEGSWGREKRDFSKTSAFAGEFEGMGGERRRVVREASGGGRKKGYGVGRVDVEEKVIREVQNFDEHDDGYGDVSFVSDLRCDQRRGFDRRIRCAGENVKSWKDSGCEGRDGCLFEKQEGMRRKERNGNMRASSFGRESNDEDNVKSVRGSRSGKMSGFDRRIRDVEENVKSWRDSDHENRETFAYENELLRRKVGFQERDDNMRASSSRQEVYNRRIMDEEENVNGWTEYGHKQQHGCYNSSRSSDTNRYSDYRKESNLRNDNRKESLKNLDGGESSSIVDRRIVGQAESRKSSLRDSKIERTSSLERRFGEQTVKEREDRLASVKDLVQITSGEKSQINTSVDKRSLNRQHEAESSTSMIHGAESARANSSKGYVEIRKTDERASCLSSSSQKRLEEEEKMKSWEDKSTSVENLVRDRRNERTQVNQQEIIDNSKFNEQHENQINSSRINSRNTKRVSNANSSLLIMTDGRQEHSTSAVNLVHVVRDDSRIESEQDASLAELRRRRLQRTSDLQESSTSRIDNQTETSSSVMEQENWQRASLIGEDSQSTEVQIGVSVSLHGSSDSEYQVKNDALESATRLDESSAAYVGEFINKLRQEASASESSEVSTNKAHKGNYQETAILEIRKDDDITRQRDKNGKELGVQSSSRSRLKGPPDEMWEVKGMPSLEPCKVEEPEEDSSAIDAVDSNTSPAIAETAISKRSHRSLWTYIAEIMKVGWGHRISHSSTQKSGTKSSSNGSISSEAWFSGNEHDDNDHATDKTETVALPKDISPLEQLVEQSSKAKLMSPGTSRRIWSSKSDSGAAPEKSEVEKGQRDTLSITLNEGQSSAAAASPGSFLLPETRKDLMRKTDGVNVEEEHVEKFHLGPSTSVSTISTGSSSKGVTLVLGLEDMEWSEGVKGRIGTIFSADQSSRLQPGKAPPSIPETESVQMFGTVVGGLEEAVDKGKLPIVGGAEGRDGELKRRKLQRNKQVLREQFDEWEEAYKRESEQRKMDEFFMREALLEAKKAADTWEVPVGAVLVHDGKIIARGCNLVEELRDSTAHAEMICIREASKLLRTWRLAETILYVTLEPCPMCAGAILQARIDTVVWGAPNKLLGADGSWVRLFPSGVGEGGSSTLEGGRNQNQVLSGPVHPFHPKIAIRRGILATECADAMQQFFQLRRKKKNELSPPASCLQISAHPTKLLTKMHDFFCFIFCL